MVTAYYELVYAIVAAYVIFNLKHDIQMLQQNSYFLSRYWKWLKTDIASGWRLIDLALIFLLFSTLLSTGYELCDHRLCLPMEDMEHHSPHL